VIARTQSLVLGFFALAWVSLVVILLVAPAIYDSAMKLPAGKHHLAGLAILGGISAFIALLSVEVLRRWSWAFWLILVAFLIGGAVRTPASVLELTGVLPPAGPPMVRRVPGPARRRSGRYWNPDASRLPAGRHLGCTTTRAQYCFAEV
jgi:hypothetical protein